MRGITNNMKMCRQKKIYEFIQWKVNNFQELIDFGCNCLIIENKEVLFQTALCNYKLSFNDYIIKDEEHIFLVDSDIFEIVYEIMENKK